MKKLSHSQIATLVTRTQQGDAAAFATLYAATVDSQLYFATTFLQDSSSAEDVVQEVYLSIYQNLHKLQNPKLFVAYLNRICYNACVDYKKKLAKTRHELYEDSLACHPDKTIENNPDNRYQALEQSHEIYAALSTLPDQQRAAFLLRYYHNMKIKDIAHILSCSESTVKRHIKAAAAALHKKL